MDKDLSSESHEPYTKADIEHSRNQMIATKVTSLLEKNPSTSTRRIEEADTVMEEIESTIAPHENDKTLQRLNYSKVSIAKLTEYNKKGEIIYPLAMNLTTYDLNGGEKDSYEITELSPGVITVTMEDNENKLAIGFDVEDSAPSFDITRFDPDKQDGFIPASRKMTPQEELELQSVLSVCELTVDNLEA